MDSSAQDIRLLRALTEQLKLPLIQIARMAEFAKESNDGSGLASIGNIADMALGLIDAFLLSADLRSQQTFPLEPVSLSSVLNDTAHKLSFIATQNDCDLRLSIEGKYGPVMAHRESLEYAMTLLGYGLISARSNGSSQHKVVLTAYKNTNGIVAGVFDNQPGLSADTFRRGHALFGATRQTMPSLIGGNGASIFVADTLMRAMEAPLRTVRHNTLSGFAATLNPSAQLVLL